MNPNHSSPGSNPADRLDYPLLSADDVASLLNVSKRTLETLVHDGDLVPIRIRGVRRFALADIEAFVYRCAGSAGGSA